MFRKTILSEIKVIRKEMTNVINQIVSIQLNLAKLNIAVKKLRDITGSDLYEYKTTLEKIDKPRDETATEAIKREKLKNKLRKEDYYGNSKKRCKSN